MGLFKRFGEKTKQSLGLKSGDADWKPTSNARNIAMIDETRKFSKQLKAMHKDFSEMAKRYDVSMGVMKTVLTSPLPRVYEVSDRGPVPVERETGMVGIGVNFEVMSQSGADLKARLQNDVLRPLEQWLSAYREIKRKNLKCEAIRLELDAQRRAAIAAAATLDKQKTKINKQAAAAAVKSTSEGGAGAAPPAAEGKGRSSIEHGEFKLQTEEDKVTRQTQRFVEKEAEVFNALLTLIKDTGVLKAYAAAALNVYEAAYKQAHTAFPAMAPPAPAPTESQGGTPPNDQTPAWYNEAMQNVPSMNYDSEDEK